MPRLQIRFPFNYITRQTGVALFYALFVYLHLHYFSLLKFVAAPYLASGIAVSVLILWGTQYALGVLFGAFLALILSDVPAALMLTNAISATCQALIGFYLIEFYCKKNNSALSLKSLKDYFFLNILVCLVSTTIRPFFVSLALYFSGAVSAEFFFVRFSTLWLGEAVACVFLVPLILIAFRDRWSLPALKTIVQASLLCCVCFFAGQIIFFDWFQLELGNIAKPYWMFLFISWIAIAFGPRLTSLVLFFVSIQSFLGTIAGSGAFGEDLILTGLSNFSFFILIVCFLGMSLAFYASEQIEYKNTLLTKLNELQLRDRALNAISQGVVITDAMQRITYVNHAFQNLTGYTQDELIGRSCSLLHGVDSNEETIIDIRRTLNNKESFFGEIFNYKKDGTGFWNELSICPVQDFAGNLAQFVGVQHDITQRKLAESQAALASAVFNNNPNAILVTDAEQNIMLVNAMFASVTGYEANEVIGKKPSMLSSGQHDRVFYNEMWRKINADRRWEGEVWNCRKNGDHYPEWLQINAVVNDRDEVTNYIGMFVDLSPHKKAEEDIQRLVNFDVLTGLPNLLFMQSQSDRALNHARLNQSSLAILTLDLDHFKDINDTIGHHFGDLLLIESSKRLQNLLREGDVLSRRGGDEFIVLLPRTSKNGASHVAQKILNAFFDPFNVDQHMLKITSSVGIALYPQDGHDFADLFKCADTALFHAKEHGRNNFQFYDGAMSNEVNERVSLESALQLAASEDQFDLHYQALIDLQSGKITGFEALIRWTHPILGAISPAKFIPVAEECGAINAIGAWVLDTACRDIRRWLDAGLMVPQIAINFSPRQFRNTNAILHIQDALARYQLPASALCIEITEGVLMEDADVSQITLIALKQMGIALSLDDFGTGYSSLSYLKLFPFDKVKIDQSFVREITSSTQNAAIVIAIIGMAHSLGIKVLAEGVETEAQCEFLRNNMSDEIQGYFFSKPIPSDAAEILMREDRQLPPKLLRLNKPEKTLLLVDDEQNIVSSLKRLLRRDGYHILTANSGQEGLDVLAGNKVDVIISDQRMPGMTGVEFLRNVKEIYPETVRMVLSGYTELNSVTDAINEGAVFRFLTKPWDDEKLRENIKEAFHYKELADDNRQLSLKVRTSNHELAIANRHLAEILQQKQQQITRDALSLDIVREVLQHTPVAVIGLDDANVVAFVNDAAMALFADAGAILGEELTLVLPELNMAISNAEEATDVLFNVNENYYHFKWRRMGEFSESSGKLIIFSKVSRI
ncbi:MAG: EAL domain-containing protein [Undibacterium sp.]|uniref:EAL domain-containing protein n=1 Tax=Undibacterium sp. TaxID=1914977 RepID=UPI0027250A08|nr:EAL domain-containing protein [Undibacterium sp.]MDO8650663.1 EAL domain-containing protein [Undibacterium sp.]